MPTMTMSPAGRRMLITLEGYKTTAYRDSKGLLTIGVGHLLTQQELASGAIVLHKAGRYLNWKEGISKADVDALLEQDLPEYESAINRLVKTTLTQWQFDSVVSFCFNVGEPAFTRSTLLKCLNAGDFKYVPLEMRKWNKVKVDDKLKVVAGLVNRREKEIKCFNGELYRDAPVQTTPQQAAPPIAVSLPSPAPAPQPQPLPTVVPRQYVPNRWLDLVNPLDWFPRWGTYVSIAAALILFVIDMTGYPVSEWAYAILGAFATARMRRAIDRNQQQNNYGVINYDEYS